VKNIKVLGSGCANCKATTNVIERVAAEHGVEIELEKVEDMQQIMAYHLMSTPGVVIDGEVVHSGGIPSTTRVEGWLL